jgi:hypothetical protein
MWKLRSMAIPAWIPALIDDERSLIRYLMSKHEGHPYAEDVLDGVCLLTSWALIAIAFIAVLGVAIDAIV